MFLNRDFQTIFCKNRAAIFKRYFFGLVFAARASEEKYENKSFCRKTGGTADAG